MRGPGVYGHPSLNKKPYKEGYATVHVRNKVVVWGAYLVVLLFCTLFYYGVHYHKEYKVGDCFINNQDYKTLNEFKESWEDRRESHYVEIVKAGKQKYAVRFAPGTSKDYFNPPKYDFYWHYTKITCPKEGEFYSGEHG